MQGNAEPAGQEPNLTARPRMEIAASNFGWEHRSFGAENHAGVVISRTRLPPLDTCALPHDNTAETANRMPGAVFARPTSPHLGSDCPIPRRRLPETAGSHRCLEIGTRRVARMMFESSSRAN